MPIVTNVRFEHYKGPRSLGVHECSPRLSWSYSGLPADFQQSCYEVEIVTENLIDKSRLVLSKKCPSSLSMLVPWPFDEPLRSRQKVSLRVRAYGKDNSSTSWSEPVSLEVGLLQRSDWSCQRIAAPWAPQMSGPESEQLFRKDFILGDSVRHARLYITAQGVYEAEINGVRVSDDFMAPGWTAYAARIPYQTYDVTSYLRSKENCLGIRVAEGWFCGRLGFEGGHRNIWGPHTALMAQLEIVYTDGHEETFASDGSWTVVRGPIRLAEIYDGEKYDATAEICNWSKPGGTSGQSDQPWEPVLCLPPLDTTIELVAGFSEPVRRTEIIKPVKKIISPSSQTIIDFGQNLVGYVELRGIKGPRGHKITIRHAEVLENEELGTRPLRICKATDEYTLKGFEEEQYEPRFTFHGFRYVQVDGWTSDVDLISSIQAVVTHTDMKPVGTFSCSDALLNQLYKNICWGMRGNFLAVPTDCPQRDERLGWTGDLAVFVSTATLIYDSFGLLKNWLIDVAHDQKALNGVPPLVSPDVLFGDPVWSMKSPCAIWHDVTILAPWALYEETGDESILSQQYDSMTSYLKTIPRNTQGSSRLWDPKLFQIGDWLDPSAPADAPYKGATDPGLVANAFLIHSLDLITQIASILGHSSDAVQFAADSTAVRADFQNEYVTPNGRLSSDSQAAYALAITFDLLTPAQRKRSGIRLAELVRQNNFRIATGFAATPFICEALAATGHVQVAYAMLLEQKCPSWLYPVTMGATTMWERWDSMLPDGSINPGQMTSFNHYAFGAVGKFMYERVAGLQRLEPGWKRCRIAPAIGADFSSASASHLARNGLISCSWSTTKADDDKSIVKLDVKIPYGTIAEIILPGIGTGLAEVVGAGEWSFQSTFVRDYEWPVLPKAPLS